MSSPSYASATTSTISSGSPPGTSTDRLTWRVRGRVRGRGRVGRAGGWPPHAIPRKRKRVRVHG
eukprot:scaffold62598_cov45-Phaeocystis_antarctica.AAC.2